MLPPRPPIGMPPGPPLGWPDGPPSRGGHVFGSSERFRDQSPKKEESAWERGMKHVKEVLLDVIVCLFVCLSVRPFVCMCVCLSVYLSVCLSI